MPVGELPVVGGDELPAASILNAEGEVVEMPYARETGYRLHPGGKGEIPIRYVDYYGSSSTRWRPDWLNIRGYRELETRWQ